MSVLAYQIIGKNPYRGNTMIVYDTTTIAYNVLKLTLSNRTWHGMPSLQVVNTVEPLLWTPLGPHEVSSTSLFQRIFSILLYVHLGQQAVS